LIIAIVMINIGARLLRRKAKIVSGASFCQVAKIIQDSQDREVITGGNQKWNGAMPNFNMMADIRIMPERWNECVDH